MKRLGRKILHGLLPHLPVALRDEIVRRSIVLPTELASHLIFKIAETTDELEAAFRLVYQSYLPLGYCQENKYQMRATIYHALPTTTTLIAVDQEKNQVVGTLTVVRDNRLGLPLEKIFDVKALRHNSHRLAEITSLVIHKDYRREKGGQILFPLLRLMYEYSTSCFGVNHLVVSIHPKDAFFYKSLLLFKDIPKTGVEDYLGAPAVSLHLDLQRALFDYEQAYVKKESRRNIFDFFVKRKMANIRLPKREYNKINDPLVSESYFQKVFQDQLQLGLESNERRRVASYLQEGDPLRSHPRIEVEAPAKIRIRFLDQGINVKVTIKDVSRSGFRAHIEHDFSAQTEFEVRIEVAPQVFAEVKAQAMWVSPERGVGFQIVQADKAWHKFIDFLYREQFNKAA